MFLKHLIYQCICRSKFNSTFYYIRKLKYYSHEKTIVVLIFVAITCFCQSMVLLTNAFGKVNLSSRQFNFITWMLNFYSPLKFSMTYVACVWVLLMYWMVSLNYDTCAPIATTVRYDDFVFLSGDCVVLIILWLLATYRNVKYVMQVKKLP